ncbi:hypothetical protein DK926_18725 [Rhodococcus sp. Eu-32]|uniref:hypothetical protein n=1 Tax=Rhodococcus sp. Eu-32 TaxID=1017319 RepID=UPI000DF13B3C|nr:hypothetical protein [Rhodococcus sp. Eu-32]RRQ26283.1 hypothetical protein DK926_18725 [Rhodococcus sp. Eu-32]
MSLVDDQLVLSEKRATLASEALYDRASGTHAMVEAALAQRDATHALALVGQDIATALTAMTAAMAPRNAPAISVSKLAGAIRDGYRAAPSPVDHEEYIARFVLGTLGIEAVA